jgi:hypothetical protein
MLKYDFIQQCHKIQLTIKMRPRKALDEFWNSSREKLFPEEVL